MRMTRGSCQGSLPLNRCEEKWPSFALDDERSNLQGKAGHKMKIASRVFLTTGSMWSKLALANMENMRAFS